MKTEPKKRTWLRSITRPAGGSSLRGASTIWAACWIRFSGMLSTSGDGTITAMSPCRSTLNDSLWLGSAVITPAWVRGLRSSYRAPRLPRPAGESSYNDQSPPVRERREEVFHVHPRTRPGSPAAGAPEDRPALVAPLGLSEDGREAGQPAAGR